MSTIRKRGDSCTCIVRKKKAGEIIFQEYKTFTGPDAETFARDWGKRLESKIARDGVPQRKLSATTLGALLRSHLTVMRSVKPVGRAREHEVEQLASEFDKQRLDQLSAHVFTKFAQRRRAAGAGPSTVLHNLSTIRSALGTAKPLHGLEVSAESVKEAITALTKMKIVSKSRKRTRRPTAQELLELEAEFARLATHPATIIPMTAIMNMAIELPRRLGELTEMLWTNYDKKARTIKLIDTKNPKEPRTEVVPVPPAAATIMESLPVVDERILPYNKESISAAWQRACARIGVEDLHFHDLRREGVSRLFTAGLDIPRVAQISGHLDWSMLKIYTELRPQDVLEKLT